MKSFNAILMIQLEQLNQNQDLKVDLSKVRDRLPQKTFRLLQDDSSIGKWKGGYKIVDGGIALVLELSNGSTCWFLEDELSVA